MYQRSDYDSILRESIQNDLFWYEQEFDLIFRNKKEFLLKDLNLANLILEKLIKILSICQNEQLLDSFALTINKIKRKYPAFF